MAEETADSYSFLTYDTFDRWASYWHQIRSVVQSEARTILLVGKGNGLVLEYLRLQGMTVICVDFRADLSPDVVCDVRELSRFIDPHSMDAACAFQVLEHLPYADFVPALKQLASVSKKQVILSLPQAGIFFSIRLRWKSERWRWGGTFRFRPHKKISKKHFWEIGMKEYSLKRIVNDIQSVMDIKNQYSCPDNPYHRFFECHIR